MKKLLSVVLVIFLSVCINSFTVSAKYIIPGGAGKGDEAATDMLDPDFVKKNNEIQALKDAVENGIFQDETKGSESLAKTWEELPKPFVCFAPENGNYSLTAVIQSVLDYFKNSSYTQKQIVSKLKLTVGNTDLDAVAELLNQNQDATYYLSDDETTSKEALRQIFHKAITEYEVPIILKTDISHDDPNWDYYTEYHTSCIEAMRGDKMYCRIADPSVMRVNPNSNTEYQKSVTVIYNVTTDYMC